MTTDKGNHVYSIRFKTDVRNKTNGELYVSKVTLTPLIIFDFFAFMDRAEKELLNDRLTSSRSAVGHEL